jgi:putative chitinase
MIDRKIFYDAVRKGPFSGRLNQGQVEGCGFLISEFERAELKDLRWLAYILATAFWETARTMQPIKEMGSQKYLRGKKYWPWIGRGYVQLTWKANYEKFREEVKSLFSADIIANPDEAMIPNVAAYIAFEGMIHGIFTGKKLSDYFNDEKTDWINARRIINGTDKAATIAGIAKQFHAALVKAEEKS